MYKHGGSDEALFGVLTKGVPGTPMPGFNLSGLQTWQVVTHLRSLVVARATSLAKGNAVAGRKLFETQCVGCHQSNGPDLANVGARRSLTELRTSVVEPDAVVPSEWWSMSLETKSGAKVRGIRLNEDTHSIQLRDKSRLFSVLKRDVAGSELVRRSPMPSFAGKLSAAQIEDVVAYLTTLRGE